MIASQRIDAARECGYLLHPDRRERDRAWITYCQVTPQSYIMIIQTSNYAYVLIECAPVAEACSPAFLAQLKRAAQAAISDSDSAQAKIRQVGTCIRIQSIKLADVIEIPQATVLHFVPFVDMRRN